MKSLFSFLVLTAACGITNTPRNALGFEFAQGVIVDPLHSVVYMMNPESSIDAVSLPGGEVLANSVRGAKPLLLYDGILLAQDKAPVDMLTVVGLTAKDLRPTFHLDLPLPKQVRTGSFYASARIESNEVIVRWRSIQRPISAIPTREPAYVTAGFARIDPATGRLIGAGEGELSDSGSSRVEIPGPVQKLADEGALASPFCWVDDLIAAIQYVENHGEKRMTLRRWNRHTGEGLPAVSLFGGELAFRSFSRDCRNLLASRAEGGWIWHIYSVITGEQIAQIKNPLPGAEFFVSGGNVIYESPAVGAAISAQFRTDPPRLVAMDLNTGRELWARPIGETAHVGPYPGNAPNPLTGHMGTERK